MFDTRRMKRVSFIFAATLLVAVLIEILFFSLEKIHEPDSYRTADYPAAQFSTYEFRVDDEGYYTLAKDSYLEIENIGPLKAQSIDLMMERQNDDTSEMVLRFTGRSSGVSGTFVVGIKRISENHYRATADFDSIDSIKIYPTEKNNVYVSFDGITINSVIVKPTFSIYRILLWMTLLLAVHRVAVMVQRHIRKQAKTNIWPTVYIFATAVVALFAYVFTSLFHTASQIGYLLIPLAVAAFSIGYLFIYIVAIKIKKLEIKAVLLFFVCGIAFTFATAPLQVPDEGNHFARCYAISMGSFGFNGDFSYPEDVTNLYDSFSENLKMYQTYNNQPSASERLASYLQKNDLNEDARKVFSNSQLILPYLPSAISIALVRVFTPSALAALYASRIGNVIVASFAVLFALKKAVRYRIPLLLVVFFPLTIFMVASASYDAMLLTALIVYLGIISSDDIFVKDVVLLAAAFSIIIMIKPLYLPLALLVFAIPKSSIHIKVRPVVLIGTVAIAGVAVWLLSLVYAGLFSHNIVPSSVLIGVDKAAQVEYILKNPFRFLAVAVVDSFRKSFYIGEYGLFGHLDLTAKLTTIIAPIQIVLCSCLSYGDSKIRRRKSNLLFLVLLFLMYIVISAGFYVVDSSLGSSTILGIQARYFIPSVFVASCLLSNLFTEHIRLSSTRKALLFSLLSGFSLSLLASIEVFAGYYLR